MLVSMVLDRFLLIIFFIINLVVSAGILLKHPGPVDPEVMVSAMDDDKEFLETYIP